MATIITYPSALEYWLYEKGIPYYFHFYSHDSRVKNKEVLQSSCSRKDITSSLEELKFSSPVHVLVSDAVNRVSSETIITHKMPEHLPEYSFIKISEDIFIVSPELCFLQASSSLSIPELVLLANDLCAIYIKDDQEEYFQRKRTPVTTTGNIRAYIYIAKNIRGIKNAKTSIKYALDNSNSPMESRLSVLATLPLSWGGYGLIKPQLNLFIAFTKNAVEYSGQTGCYCDMAWVKQKVVLEYDSTLTHLEIHQHYKDKKRATALTISGYKVISITAEQIKSFRNIETMFYNVREVLKMQKRQERFDMYFERRWEVVHTILLQNR